MPGENRSKRVLAVLRDHFSVRNVKSKRVHELKENIQSATFTAHTPKRSLHLFAPK